MNAEIFGMMDYRFIHIGTQPNYKIGILMNNYCGKNRIS